MALAYTEHSKYANRINADNWTDLLLKEGVKTGHSNPNLDPCGYRSVLVAKLAEKYYKKEGFYETLLGYRSVYKAGDEKREKVIVRPKETDLLALLEVHAIDYLFIYRSVAEQHSLKYVTLPKEVSLKEAALTALYEKVSFEISGKKPGETIRKKGAAMVYGLTIPQNSRSPQNPKGAVAFVNFILSDEGQAIMQRYGQGVIKPPVVTGNSTLLDRER